MPYAQILVAGEGRKEIEEFFDDAGLEWIGEGLYCFDEDQYHDATCFGAQVEILASPPGTVPLKPKETVIRSLCNPSDVLTLKPGFVRRCARRLGFPVPLHNVEVLEVLDESTYGVLVRIKATDRVVSHCSFCGLRLEDPLSVATGIGPVCARKHGVRWGNAQSTREDLRRLVDSLSRSPDPLWIPRSAISRIASK